MTVRINKQKINLREKLTEFEDKVNFNEVVRGLGEYTGNVSIGGSLFVDDGGGVGIGTENPSEKLDVDGNLFIAGQLTGGLGGRSTTATATYQDWNHSRNARAGMGMYLLLGNYANGPEFGLGPNKYFHVLNFEYSSKNGSGNLSQWAIGYTENLFYMRVRYDNTWTAWTQII